MLSLLFPFTLAAQDWHTGEAVVPVVNITPEAARTKAFELAREQALAHAGLEISGATGRMTSESPAGFQDLLLKFSSTRSRGLIVAEDTLRDALVIAGDQPRWEVKINAQVKLTIGAPDPGFKLEMKLNRESSRHGESLVITLQSTRECYVTIFCISDNDSLTIIAPNPELKEVYIEPGVPVVLPPPRAIWSLRLSLAEDDTASYEAILAVATRERIDFPSLGAVENERLLSLGDALLRRNRWLSDIPLDRRTEAWAFYKVSR